MKSIIYLGLAFIFFLTSCTDLEEIGENPNNVSQTPPQLLLTQILENTFQVEGSSPLYASRMIVSTSGENTNQYYKWNRGNYDEYDRLRNVTKMIEESQRENKLAYEALGKFLRAYFFYNLTLEFGDVPYSNALKGEAEEIYAPEYDSQEEVFIGILNELEQANDLISNDDVIDGDIVYYGDASRWKKLINSFRLKVLITLSNKTGSDFNLKQRFAAIVNNQSLLASIDDNGQLEFVDQVGSQYGEFNNSDYGSDVYMDSTFVQRLSDREDPRLFIYADQTKNAKENGLAVNDFNAYGGGKPIGDYQKVVQKASDGNVSLVNNRYYDDPTNEPHVLLGYDELEFILAEAAVRGWVSSDPETHYENGVKASFQFYNKFAESYAEYVSSSDADNYLQSNLVNFANAKSEEEKIELIITQKYIRSFLQGGWTMYYEHLRTGYPEFLNPSTGRSPYRWMYPQVEIQNNLSNVTKAIERQFGAGNDDIRSMPWWLE